MPDPDSGEPLFRQLTEVNCKERMRGGRVNDGCSVLSELDSGTTVAMEFPLG